MQLKIIKSWARLYAFSDIFVNRISNLTLTLTWLCKASKRLRWAYWFLTLFPSSSTSFIRSAICSVTPRESFSFSTRYWQNLSTIPVNWLIFIDQFLRVASYPSGYNQTKMNLACMKTIQHLKACVFSNTYQGVWRYIVSSYQAIQHARNVHIHQIPFHLPLRLEWEY